MFVVRVHLLHGPAAVPARRRGVAHAYWTRPHAIVQRLFDEPAPRARAGTLRYRTVPTMRIRLHPPAVRVCPPTSRRIAIELESRFKAPMSEVRAGQGLCSGKGQVWTVSGNKSAPWRQAVAACASARCSPHALKSSTGGWPAGEDPRSDPRGGATVLR